MLAAGPRGHVFMVFCCPLVRGKMEALLRVSIRQELSDEANAETDKGGTSEPMAIIPRRRRTFKFTSTIWDTDHISKAKQYMWARAQRCRCYRGGVTIWDQGEGVGEKGLWSAAANNGNPERISHSTWAKMNVVTVELRGQRHLIFITIQFHSLAIEPLNVLITTRRRSAERLFNLCSSAQHLTQPASGDRLGRPGQKYQSDNEPSHHVKRQWRRA
ncbi:hypothetical protein BV22DRAFT_1048418 [Leucogyrophana mollusca]|uniref:Uncharacterized protein n=1 Tax=Leucogyrophana mollusca TaxID=85980 RepID=A0ACB8BBE0_9AGAM|nr:hypothetical protein BV22DRAFT_1048418 [Leucogyrophana mollusca]